MKKKLAEESEKTKRARQKLKRRLEMIEQQVTPKALEKKSIEIHRWIARHAAQRVVLRTKAISLFDENKNTAETSRRIAKLAETLQKELVLSLDG